MAENKEQAAQAIQPAENEKEAAKAPETAKETQPETESTEKVKTVKGTKPKTSDELKTAKAALKKTENELKEASTRIGQLEKENAELRERMDLKPEDGSEKNVPQVEMMPSGVPDFLKEYVKKYPKNKTFYVTSDRMVYLEASKPDAFFHQSQTDRQGQVQVYKID